jgi:hypothetical protein
MQTVAQRAGSAPISGAIHAITSREGDEIRRKLGALPIYVLRQTYGAGFAPGTPGDVTLGEAMAWIDGSSISLLARHLQSQGTGPSL